MRAAAQPIARAAAIRGRHVAFDDALGRLGPPFLFEPRDILDERDVESFE